MTEQTQTADRILWLDLETTDLDVQRCQVLEVGCVLTKGFADGLEVVGEFTSPVWPLFGEAALEEMPEPVREMHRASGLWDACLADDDLTPEVVGVRWLSWLIEQGAVNYTTTTGSLVAGGSGIDRFDIPIIERVFAVIAREFHWRRMDISAMKLLLNELDCADLIPKQDGVAHRALADAHWARDVAWTMAYVIARSTQPKLFLPIRGQVIVPDDAALHGPSKDALWTLPDEAVSFSESQARLEETLASSGTALDEWASAAGRAATDRAEAMTPVQRDHAQGFLDRWAARLRRSAGGDQ